MPPRQARLLHKCSSLPQRLSGDPYQLSGIARGWESSFVYHYAKKAAIPLIIMAWVLYLALPFALAFAFAVTITASAPATYYCRVQRSRAARG